jgi:hypothetical protein
VPPKGRPPEHKMKNLEEIMCSESRGNESGTLQRTRIIKKENCHAYVSNQSAKNTSTVLNINMEFLRPAQVS